MQPPKTCPKCGKKDSWKMVSEKKVFSSAKASKGVMLHGAAGLLDGVAGKRLSVYHCSECGFENEYDPSKLYWKKTIVIVHDEKKRNELLANQIYEFLEGNEKKEAVVISEKEFKNERDFLPLEQKRIFIGNTEQLEILNPFIKWKYSKLNMRYGQRENDAIICIDERHFDDSDILMLKKLKVISRDDNNSNDEILDREYDFLLKRFLKHDLHAFLGAILLAVLAGIAMGLASSSEEKSD